jgi:hypothetical protein
MTSIHLAIAGIPLCVKGEDFCRSLHPVEKRLLRPFVVTERRDQARCFLDVAVSYIESLKGARGFKLDPRFHQLIRRHFYHKEDEYFKGFFGHFLKDTMLPYLKGHCANKRTLKNLLKDSRNGNRIAIQRGAFVVYNHDRRSYEVLLKPRDRSCEDLYTYHLKPLRLLFRMVLNSVQDSIMLHASSIEQDGNGYAFVGQSGSGKSTVVKMLQPERILSDDTTIVRRVGKQYQIYPNPWWNGSSKIKIPNSTSSSRLRAIFFITPSQKTSVKKLAYKEALSLLIYWDRFFQQAGFFDNQHGIKAFCVAAQELLHHIPAFQLDIEKSQKFRVQFNNILAQYLLN